MAFLIPEAGIAAEGLLGGGEALEDAKIAERTVPKMEPAVEKSSSLKDLFLYKATQQSTQAPVIINNQNIQNQQVQQIAQPAIPIIQPAPIEALELSSSTRETKTEEDNNIVSIENNNIIKVEEKQINNEAKQIQELQEQPPTKSTIEQIQEMIDIYNKNLTIFQNQMNRQDGYLRTSMYQ